MKVRRLSSEVSSMAGFVAFLAFLKGLVSPLIAAWRSAKRRKLHIFVSKAIATTPGALAPDVTDRQFDLASIDRKLQIAQRHQLFGSDMGEERLDGEVFMVPLPEDKALRKLARDQSKMGLPGIRDADRQQKLEQILHDMVEAGRLHFHAPNRWSIT